ncbi:hypothetical protein MXB_2809 [Myxobolus squamalis]|nr:hypothetical protein MXB_2809 [Myxobolus squamalis]
MVYAILQKREISFNITDSAYFGCFKFKMHDIFDFNKDSFTEKNITNRGIPKLIEKFGATVGEKPYIFSQTTKESKIFKRFLTTIVQNYTSELIFQSEFLKNFLIWLKPLSESNIRAFRHISVSCALTISNELCNIHCNLQGILKSKPITQKRSRQGHLDRSFAEGRGV